MTVWNRRSAVEVTRRILSTVRERVQSEGLDLKRLPRFLVGASARIGWIRDALIVAFDDATVDSVYVIGPVRADVTVLAEVADSKPSRYFLPIRSGLKCLTLQQWANKEPFTVVFQHGTAFTDVGYGSDQGPVFLFDVSFELEDASVPPIPLQRRLVPFAMEVMSPDVVSDSAAWSTLGDHALSHFREIAASPLGETHASRHLKTRAFLVTPTKSVIVLGSYKPERRAELESVRDALRAIKYSADLIEDFPDAPFLDVEQKVRWWTLTSRFCVLVDHEPSGHLVELDILTQQRTITAIARPHGRPSSAMLAKDPSRDYTFIRAFSYEKSPLEILPQCSLWAESQFRARTNS